MVYTPCILKILNKNFTDYLSVQVNFQATKIKYKVRNQMTEDMSLTI